MSGQKETTRGRHVIGDKTVAPSSGEYLPVIDPSTGSTYAEIARGTAPDVDRAVEAARTAQRGWARLEPVERSRAMLAVSQAVLDRREDLARLESREIGKPLRQARADVDIAARYFEFYGGLADKFRGTTIPLGEGGIDYTVREPLGVSGQIVPWRNYPLQIGARGMAAPLAARNTVVIKPAEDGSTSLLHLADLARQAGVPPGAINVITGLGTEAGAALASHPGIDQLTFTGSVPTGVAITQAAAPNIVPVVLELGGKCPALVFADADLEAAAATIAIAATQNSGQTCSGISRVIVASAVHGDLVERLAVAFAEIEVGIALEDPGMGPLVSAAQRDRMARYVEVARSEGGEIIAGGTVPSGPPADGFYLSPTLVDRVEPDSRIANEEVFGPVLSVIEAGDDEEAVAIGNRTEFGLVAGVWTSDVSRAHRVAAQLESGQVFVNSYGAAGGVELPFGGFKKSGIGREKGIEGLDSYLQTKNVCIRL